MTVLAAFIGAARAVAGPLAVVEVWRGAFSPRDTHVDQGGTVRFVVREAGHTITADGCQQNDPNPCWFDFPEPPRGTTAEGDAFDWNAPDESVTVRYHCEIHSSMAGTITIGTGSPLPSPSPTPGPVFRDVPTLEFGTIQAAVDGASFNTTVRVAPGVYDEAVTVTSAGVTIQGAPDGTTVLDGQGVRSTGIGVTSDHVRIRDLTVQNFRSDGLVFLSVNGFAVERVRAIGNKAHGVLIRSSRRGTVTDSEASGSAHAAFMVASCADCDVTLTGLRATASGVGYLGEASGSVVLRRSELDGNSTGVMLVGQNAGDALPRGGTHVYGNAIRDNNLPIPWTGSSARLRAVAGVGVWAAGSWLDRIEANTVTGHDRYGIAVTAFRAPVYGSSVTRNVVSGSGLADLAWDGLGADVCFSGNGPDVSSEPPFLVTLYACGAHLPVGVPDPLVDAELFLPSAFRPPT